ncbi:MAG: hypothetical protein WA347_03765 [Rhabdochlamydiaceae bacterium]|jgi:hypothetical protein
MRTVLIILLFLKGWLFAIQTDYDVALVGTSPIAMLEAIYHISKGERVLILEADEKCGGAWKSIDICGIANADLGCHLIGSDSRLKDFFKQYFGCRFTCLAHPDQEAVNSHAKCATGYYFSEGCYELISRLLAVIQSHNNAVLLHRKLESIFIDSSRESIDLFLGDMQYTTAKLILTPSSHFQINNPSFINPVPRSHLFHHLYLLVEDETPSRFTYLNGIISGMSRAMNLTPFLKFPRENLQLIVIQTHGEKELTQVEKFMNALIDRNYLSSKAKVLVSDTYFYHQSYMNASAVAQIGGTLIEVLDTSSFTGMIKYLEKWKSAMTPLQLY